jgi:predicted aspartyl protease
MPIPKPFALLAAFVTILLSLFVPAARSTAQDAPSAPAAKTASDQPVADSARWAIVPAINGVELKAEINGQGPFDAVFDTGAGNLMTASLATRLGLKLGGAITIVAAGGNVPAQGVKVATVKIGDLTMTDQWFTVVDLPYSKGEEGIFVGGDLVSGLPVKVDFEKQQITFYHSRGFSYSGDGVAVPIRLEEGVLVAEGSVDGVPGLFGIDTGDMYSLSLSAPFVAQHDLVKHYGATIRGYAGEGFGGADTGLFTRASLLRLGQMSVSRPITVLSVDSQGRFASSAISGNIGLHILKQFTITFDYPHGKMYLEKNSNYGKPDIFNRAGLLLNLEPDDLKIETVIPGSPAARAGLAEGDVITQIDGGQPTDDSIQSAFTQPAGTILHLTVRHAGTIHSVSLSLEDVL